MCACRVRQRSGWRRGWMGDDLERLVEARVTSGESYQRELGAERLRFNDGTGGDRWLSKHLKLICMSHTGTGSPHVVFDRTCFCVWVEKKKQQNYGKSGGFRRRVNLNWATFQKFGWKQLILPNVGHVTSKAKVINCRIFLWVQVVTEAKASRLLCCKGSHALVVSLTYF